MNVLVDIWRANQGAIMVLGAWCVLTLVLWAWEAWRERRNGRGVGTGGGEE